MAEFNKLSSILISLLLGGLLSVLFDNMFVLIFIGFLSTYLTKTNGRTYLVGITTSLIYSTCYFIVGFFIVPSPLPPSIALQVNLDPFNLFVGFFVTLLISIFLGFIGAYPAYWTDERFNKNKQINGSNNEFDRLR